MKARRTLFYIFIIIMLLIDIALILEASFNADQSSMQSSGITSFIVDIIIKMFPNANIDVEVAHSVVRKVVGHFLFFGLSGIFTSLSLLFIEEPMKIKSEILTIGLFKGFLLAVSTEIIQIFVPGRSGEFKDIMIDFSGYLLFFLITYLIYYLIYKGSLKKSA